MPYHIGEKGSHGCEGFPVVKDSDNKVMGCHETKEKAQKQLAALYANEPEAATKAEKGFVAPASVRANAKRGLELREKHGRGGTAVGVARARDLMNGAALSYDTIKRMNSFFARHEVDKKGEGWGKDSAGYIAWLLWGGDAGWSWARGIIRQQESKEKSTMTDLTTAFFGIEKADRNADGTLVVYGKATDDSVDIDQQICDADWLDRAMPAWFKSGGNIREQHSNIAAGVAKEYEAKGSEHYITALVVDPVSVKKVETGVLKGFSIGIKNPRLTRDNKAANGRIIDGQIVEVSLVDRPANPNCQLVLAKSAVGEETLIQAEDLIEQNELQSEENLVKENSLMETETVTVPKSIVGDILKFDKTQFEAARDALANLIAIEAGEIKEGHNELASIHHLMEAVAHLHAWYEGEAAEGEVMIEENIELAAKKDDADEKKSYHDKYGKYGKASAGCDCPGCEKCMKGGGCDMKLCSGHKSYAKGIEIEIEEDDEDEMEKSSSVEKCLECGCNQPNTNHGLDKLPDGSNVSTAVIVSPSETPKSAEADEPAVDEVKDEEQNEISAEQDAPADVEAIVEEVVEKATQALKSEIASLVAAKEAALAKSVELESELAHAKSLAVAGGPKRTGKSSGTSNDLISKAATYKAKANATTDPLLAKGYRALADKYYAEAQETLNK